MTLLAALAASALLVTAQHTALQGVRTAPEDDAPSVSILIVDGKVRAILSEDDAIPPGYRLIDGAGHLALPAFIDTYTHAGAETPEPLAEQDVPLDTSADVNIAMREANRKGIQPAFRSVEALALREKVAGDWRAQGFGLLASAPHGELLAGRSVLATTADLAARNVVVTPELWSHAAFRASGSGYPSTLMGYHAQLRQFFYDAQRHVVLVARAADGLGGRPPYDIELERGAALLEGERLWCEAETAVEIRRWLRLGDELGFEVGITGGREAWRLADELAERGVPVVLTLDWGKEVKDPLEKEKKKEKEKQDVEPPEADDTAQSETLEEPESTEPEDAEAEDEQPEQPEWNYEEPEPVRIERRRLWEEGRDCALKLERAGVTFTFGSGQEDAKQLLSRVRELIEAGLPSDVALRALTSGAAELVGTGQTLGAIEPGRDATLAVWTKHPLGEQAKLAGIFVDGHWYEFEIEDSAEGLPDEGVDATGTWLIVYEAQGRTVEVTAVLAMDADGTVSGTYSQLAMDGSPRSGALEGSVVERTLTVSGQLEMGEMVIDFEIEGELDGDALEGTMTIVGSFGNFEIPASGTRTLQPERGEQSGERGDASGSGGETQEHHGDPDDCCNPAQEATR